MTPRHAAYLGWMVARLREYNIHVRVVYDDNDELTGTVRIILNDDTIEVVVPEPHEAWHL